MVAACYLSQCGQPTRPTETKSTTSKQHNDNDDRYLILELLEPGNTGYQLASYLPGASWQWVESTLNPFKYTQYSRSERLQCQLQLNIRLLFTKSFLCRAKFSHAKIWAQWDCTILNSSFKLTLWVDAHCCHMGTAIKHPVPDRVKPSFVIFDIRALWRSALWHVSGLLTLCLFFTLNRYNSRLDKGDCGC